MVQVFKSDVHVDITYCQCTPTDSIEITIGSGVCRLGDVMGFRIAAIFDHLQPSPEST